MCRPSLSDMVNLMNHEVGTRRPGYRTCLITLLLRKMSDNSRLGLLFFIANQHDRHPERLKKNAKLKMKSNRSFVFPLNFSATL